MPRDLTGLGATFAGLVGPDHVLAGEAARGFAVDGVAPGLVVRPGTQEEVGKVVAACAAADAAMAPWGGGTAMGLGNPPSRLDVVVRLDRLDRIVEFDAPNLNVSVEAGVPLDRLQAVLAEKGQFLPLDPAESDRVTVGGLLESNATGPSRHLYGSAREWVLGLRVALTDGERIRSGGKVIKNVSGYDMNKLFVGSLGTMGIVTEATFKLLPLPARRATVAGTFRDLSLISAVVEKTLASFLLPEALEALDPGSWAAVGAAFGRVPPPGAGLAVSLSGSPENVERQVRDFTRLLDEGGATMVDSLDGSASEEAWRAIRNVHGRIAPPLVLVKIAVPIGSTLDLFSKAGAILGEAGPRGAVTAHAGSGIVRASVKLDGDAGMLRDRLAALRAEAEEAGGSLVVLSAPPAFKRAFDAWGTARDAVAVMRRLKAQLDPSGLLNPGRFVGGI